MSLITSTSTCLSEAVKMVPLHGYNFDGISFSNSISFSLSHIQKHMGEGVNVFLSNTGYLASMKSIKREILLK